MNVQKKFSFLKTCKILDISPMRNPHLWVIRIGAGINNQNEKVGKNEFEGHQDQHVRHFNLLKNSEVYCVTELARLLDMESQKIFSIKIMLNDISPVENKESSIGPR